MGAKSVYARFGSSALVGQSQTANRYEVKGDDTLPMIAARVYPDEGYSSEAWRQLAEYNEIFDPDDLVAGDVLIIPVLRPADSEEE